MAVPVSVVAVAAVLVRPGTAAARRQQRMVRADRRTVEMVEMAGAVALWAEPAWPLAAAAVVPGLSLPVLAEAAGSS